MPRYLEDIDGKLTAEHNIKNHFFTNVGLLLEEFDKIFSDFFRKNSVRYQRNMPTLLGSQKTVDEIVGLRNIKSGSGFDEKLIMLTETGLLARDYVWKAKANSRKLNKYRLKDNCLRIYLK